MAENQTIEYKESWRDEYLKRICGLANAKGGSLFIGKKDNGEVIGVKCSEKLLEDIPNKIMSCLGISCEAVCNESNGKKIIEIRVDPQYLAISYHGKYYCRSGTTTHELNGVNLSDFLLKKLGKTWDDVIEESASLNDLDELAINRFKERAILTNRLPNIQNERFATLFENLNLSVGGKLKRATVLLFGKDPRKLYNGATFKIGRFGNSDSELKYQEVITGNIFEMVDKIVDVLKNKFVPLTIDYVGFQRRERLPYPEGALREAILNAIAHRNYYGAESLIRVYDDKLTVWNDGVLPEGLTIQNLKETHSSRPRNPRIANVLFNCGLIEPWGRGTIKIIEECKQAGLPEPVFEHHSGGFLVTLYKRSFSFEYLKKIGLNQNQINAVFSAKISGQISVKEYMKQCDTTKKVAMEEIQILISQNILTFKEGSITEFVIKSTDEFNPRI